MKRNIVAGLMVSLAVLLALSACLPRPHVPPGQIRKHTTPGHLKKY